MDFNIEAAQLVKESREKGLSFQDYEKDYNDFLKKFDLRKDDLRKVSESFYKDNKEVTGSDTILNRLMDTGGDDDTPTIETKQMRGSKKTSTPEDILRFIENKLKTPGGALKKVKSKDGIIKFIRPIFKEYFKSEKVLEALKNEEYKEILELVKTFRDYFKIEENNEDDLRKNLTSFLFYGKTGTGKKLGDTTRFFDALYNAPPKDKEALRNIVDDYIRLVKGDKSISEKFNEEREIDLLSDAVRDFGILDKEELSPRPDATLLPEDDIGVVERVDEELEQEEEETQPEEEEGETLDETLETEEQPEDPEEEPEEPPVEMEVEKPIQKRTETISNPVGTNLIDQIPASMISTQFKNIEELEEEIEFLLEKFPELLRREEEIFRRVDLEDIDQLRRLHKTIIGKLGADKQRQQIAVVIPAEDYIKSEVNKILLETALKNMRAEDIIQTINMPNRQGETDGLTVGDFVVREGNTSGLQNQGQPIYRYIPTTNQEVEDQQSRTGKIRLNTTKRTRLNVAKREFRNDPFIFRRPQPIRLKYLG